ncbi:MAG: bifunctional folylpolyglutamate synthase/dihydrofolate synthase [Bacteroidales bacterium]|nr:bifunctional folylpolyglutamate synthase/dihydrofolate synthase [Bacteroidales bacterium]
MNYPETLDYLFTQTPMFSRTGGDAYKEGLDNIISLSMLYGEPEEYLKCIHIAGTNGKGSTSHILASILQHSGYKVGLFTSPHLVDFRERIRINGEMIPKQEVVDFVNGYINSGHKGSPSFFELTTIMALDYFRRKKVDYAIIETGLGGRLDSTNIIMPQLCVITNISFDHTQFLGNTLSQIAEEKAGIIKPGIPIVIGEANNEVREVFIDKAEKMKAPIIFAEDKPQITTHTRENECLVLETVKNGTIINQLSGVCQLKNANTVLHAVHALKELGINISQQAIEDGFANVCKTTGLMGRWMLVNNKPRTICDTGHNAGGVQYIVHQLAKEKYHKLHIVLGFVNDKDVTHILEMFPRYATYYFTNASIPRALPAKDLFTLASAHDLDGNYYTSVQEAYQAALDAASDEDMIFVGGSTFVVADLLTHLKQSE